MCLICGKAYDGRFSLFDDNIFDFKIVNEYYFEAIKLTWYWAEIGKHFATECVTTHLSNLFASEIDSAWVVCCAVAFLVKLCKWKLKIANNCVVKFDLDLLVTILDGVGNFLFVNIECWMWVWFRLNCFISRVSWCLRWMYIRVNI